MTPVRILQIGELPFPVDTEVLRGSTIHYANDSPGAFAVASTGAIDVVVLAAPSVAVEPLLAHCAQYGIPPEIIVVAALLEDEAAALIESGVYDCVPPDAPRRLRAVVARAARRRASDARQVDQTASETARAEAYYRFLFEHSHDSVIVFDPWTEVILDANLAAHDLYRVPHGTLRGRSLLEFSKNPGPGRERAVALMAGTARVEFESTQVRDDGSEIALEICAAAMPYENGLAIVTTNRDVTAQNAAIAALALSEDRYRTLFDRATVGIVQGDLHGNIVTVNPALAQMLGYADVHELTKVNSGDLYADDAAREEVIAALVGGLPSVRRQVRLVGADSRVIWVDVNISTVRAGNGHVTAIEAYLLDITTRRNAEEQMRLVLESTNEGIVAADLKGHCTLINAAAARMLGRTAEEMVGRSLHDLAHHSAPDGTPIRSEDCVMRTLIETHTAFTHEDVFWRSDGTTFPIEVAGSAIFESGVRKGTVFAFRDLTHRKALERQLDATQRISGLGRVAATIAHEFNNVLMAILPMIDIIERQLTDERLCKAAGTIRTAVSRGKRITGEILRFTRREHAVRTPLGLSTYLAELHAQLLPLFDPGTDLRISGPAQELTMLADAGQLQQVFVNLAANARDAMADRGRVTITATNEPRGAFHADIRDVERYVHFRFTDNGCGMSPATQAQIFEPLFTTKPSGTGIGLAVVHQIVTEHGGTILVESEIGAGTTFDLFIPLTEAPAASAAQPDPVIETPAAGRYHILLVEDDVAVADGLQLLLELAGHRVDVIGVGLAAEETVERLHPDLVVLDVGLPDISGAVVYERLSRRWPTLPVIFATGHADIGALRHSYESPRVAFLMKPFPFDTLSAAIVTVMSATG